MGTEYKAELAIPEPRKEKLGVNGNQQVCLLMTMYTGWLVWVVKSWPTSPHLEQCWRALPVPEFPMRFAEATYYVYKWVQHHLFPVLPLQFPQSVNPENILIKAPACKLPSQCLLPREWDLETSFTKPFLIHSQWTWVFLCLKSSEAF